MPIVKGFKYIDWWRWNLVRIDTPKDGSCLFHCILNSSFYPYHTQELDKKKVSRSQMVHNFRKNLSDILPEYYNHLGNGYYQEFSIQDPYFTLINMKKELNSTHYIGHGFLEFLGLVLHLDIYILDHNTKDLYKTYEYNLSIKKTRPSIVIYYKDSHYELVAIYDEINNEFRSYFKPENDFIKYLTSKIKKN